MDGILLGKMLDAGFTKEEILSLVNPEDPKPAEENPEQKTDPKPPEEKKEENKEENQEQKTDPNPQDEKPDNNMDQRLTGIEKQIATLIKAVQTNNVKQDSIKTPPENLEAETDKIMESIIRPERQKKG